MDSAIMIIFLSGAIQMASLAIAVLFWRFWQKSRDRLFIILGVAFVLMALERWFLMFLFQPDNENRPLVYTIRLLAFLMIIWAIIDKNRSNQSPT